MRADVDAVVVAVRPLRREVLLNGDFVLQRFMHGLIGDAETARVQEAGNAVLTLQKEGSGQKFVDALGLACGPGQPIKCHVVP